MWWPESEFISMERKVQYIFHFGDQRSEKRIDTVADGGSNIHVHLIREWADQGFTVNISTYKDNYLYGNVFSGAKRITMKEYFTFSGLFKTCLVYYEILWRCLYPGLIYLFKKVDCDYIVTQTDFLPDVTVGILVKVRNPRVTWVASYFLEAPKPWRKNSPYRGGRRLFGFFYWLFQRPSFWLIRKYADFVLVTSQPDVEKFPNIKRDRSRVIVVKGGVDLDESEKYWLGSGAIPVGNRKYDACFVGRFHPQKGVLELVDVWSLVCRRRPSAKLAVIGLGSLEEEMKRRIKAYDLGRNVDLLGYLTGEPKFDVFKQSKVILHPATYDSGGMAAAEAMAWGLPGVSFDLESLKTYYPQGMLKTPCFDLQKFANNILRLLEDRELYERLSQEAHELIVRDWDWNKRAAAIVKKITGEGDNV